VGSWSGRVEVLEMEIHGVSLDVMSSQPVVVLKEKDSSRYLPIWIGQFEATAIMMQLQGIEPSRPLTHDLLRSMVDAVGIVIQRIVVSDLKDGTFYARIHVGSNGSDMDIDARPSDAIALAVRTGAPIYAEEAVLDQAGIIQDAEDEEAEIEEFKQFLESIDPEDFQVG
jgi:bifunctional DNase/RNase